MSRLDSISEDEVFADVFVPSVQDLYQGESSLIIETGAPELDDHGRATIDRILTLLEGLKHSEPGVTIIPSIRLFMVAGRNLEDLLSKTQATSVAHMVSTHLLNRRSFEAFEQRVDERSATLATQNIDALVMEITVDRKNR